MPYTSGAHGDNAACKTACDDVEQRTVKVTKTERPSKGSLSVDAVKKALQNGPLMTQMTVYEDFMFYTGGVYRHVTGSVAGGHAISIVGYSDADQAWIVRNSWGTDWGMGGFFEIAWDDDSGLGQSTWSLIVPAAGSYLAADLRDGTVFTGATQVAFDSRDLTDAITWSLGGATLQGTDSIDTTQLADGVYTLQAQAGSVRAMPKIVYVLNGTETGNIDFKKLKDGQTVKNTLKFDIGITAAPVPLTRVSWQISDESGKVVVDRNSENTGPVMELGWNTHNAPNGNYTIAVSGFAGEQTIGTFTRRVTVKN